MLPENIASVFYQFAGKEVNVHEKTYDFRGQTRTIPELDEHDPTLVAMKTAAAAKGLSLHISLPESMVSTDTNLGRVNAYIEKDKTGKYHIGKSFDLG